jgi:t-SNARE complex subunit (syntaxin)
MVNSNSNRTINYNPINTTRNKITNIEKKIKNLTNLHRSILVNHTDFNKMSPKERMKRYNNAENSLNKIEKKHIYYLNKLIKEKEKLIKLIKNNSERVRKLL